MKRIQMLSILVLVAFAPFAMGAPFQLWATCDQDSFGGGVAVDLFAAHDEVVEWVQDTFMVEDNYYVERIVPVGYEMAEGELYASVGGTPDITHSISAEEIKAYRMNPWMVGAAIIFAVGGAVCVALYTKGDSAGDDNSTHITGNDNTVNNNSGEGSSSTEDNSSGVPVAQ